MVEALTLSIGMHGRTVPDAERARTGKRRSVFSKLSGTMVTMKETSESPR